MAIHFREKKWKQSSDIYFIENIPKPAKMLQMSYNVNFS